LARMASAKVSGGCVYVLTNDRGNALYVGSTDNLKKRLYHHKHGLVPGFTKKYSVHRLVYYELYPDMDAARVREKQLKGKTSDSI
jgi:putative endonuclease